MKIGLFTAFLLAYILFFYVGFILQKRQIVSLFRHQTLLIGELSVLLTLGGLFTFFYLLSGFFSLSLFVLLLVALQLGVIISAVLWTLVGTTSVKWGPNAYFAGYEFGIKNAVFSWWFGRANPILIFGFPIAGGFVLFTNPIPSSELTVGIIQVTLIWFILLMVLGLLPVSYGILTSENLLEDTRLRMLVMQLGSLVPTALFFALVLGAFGLGASESSYSMGGVTVSLSPLMAALVFGYFFMFILVPYLSGTRRAKRLRVALMRRQRDWLTRLAEILEVPNTSRYLEKIESLAADVGGRMEALSEEDIIFDIAEELEFVNTMERKLLERSEDLPGVQDAVQRMKSHLEFPLARREHRPEDLALIAFQESRDLDLRFWHRDWLSKFANELSEVTETLGVEGLSELVKTAGSWAASYRLRMEDLDRKIQAAEKERPSGWIAVAAIVMPILSVILSEIGNSAWAIISGLVGG